MSVSYTHLDVYKRQLISIYAPEDGAGRVTVNGAPEVFAKYVVPDAALVFEDMATTV